MTFAWTRKIITFSKSKEQNHHHKAANIMEPNHPFYVFFFNSLHTVWMLWEYKLDVLWSLRLTIPPGGDKLTKLPDTRGDKRHHENKIVWCVIHRLKIGQRSCHGGWCRKRRVHRVPVASFTIARWALSLSSSLNSKYILIQKQRILVWWIQLQGFTLVLWHPHLKWKAADSYTTARETSIHKFIWWCTLLCQIIILETMEFIGRYISLAI